MHEGVEGSEGFHAGFIGGLVGVGEFLFAEADHEVMLVGESGDPESSNFCAVGEGGEIDVGGDVGVAGVLQGIVAAPVLGVAGEGASGAVGGVEDVAGPAVVDDEDVAGFEAGGEGSDPVEGIEVDLGGVAFDGGEWETFQVGSEF